MNDWMVIAAKIIIALPLVIGAGYLFILSIKYNRRLYEKKALDDFKHQFMIILKANGLTIIACLLFVYAILLVADLESFPQYISSFIPFFICLGIFVFPITVVGTLWHTFLTRKMWGGFPGYPEQVISIQRFPFSPVDHRGRKLKLPRKTVISAAIIAILTFGVSLICILWLDGFEDEIIGLIISLGFSAVLSFGTYMIIISISFSKKMERLRDGVETDDD